MRFSGLQFGLLAAAILFATAAASADDEIELPANAPDTVRMTLLLPASKIKSNRPARLLGFSWSDCGGAGAWVKIKSVGLQPDPANLNNPITVSFAYSASHSFGDGAAVSVSLVMKKKILGTWIQLPCIDNVGSCNYDNVCTSPAPPATCPADFVKAGVPCKCPFPAGDFNLPGYSFKVDASKIPSFLESGDYQVSVNANSAGNQVLCANAQLTLS